MNPLCSLVNSRELGLGWCFEAGAVKDASCRFEGLLIEVVHAIEAAEAAGQPIIPCLFQIVGHFEGHVLLDMVGSPVVLIDLDGWILYCTATHLR